MIYSAEVQHMCSVAKGAYHGPAPIPEEGKWVQVKEIKDVSGFTHGIGWCAPQQGCCKLTLNVKEGIIQEPATGHNYVETDRVEPTDSAAGYIEYTCENCSDVKTEELKLSFVAVAIQAIEVNGETAMLSIGEEYSAVKVSFKETLDAADWTEIEATSLSFEEGVATVPATTDTGFYKVEASK